MLLIGLVGLFARVKLALPIVAIAWVPPPVPPRRLVMVRLQTEVFLRSVLVGLGGGSTSRRRLKRHSRRDSTIDAFDCRCYSPLLISVTH